MSDKNITDHSLMVWECLLDWCLIHVFPFLILTPCSSTPHHQLQTNISSNLKIYGVLLQHPMGFPPWNSWCITRNTRNQIWATRMAHQCSNHWATRGVYLTIYISNYAISCISQYASHACPAYAISYAWKNTGICKSLVESFCMGITNWFWK